MVVTEKNTAIDKILKAAESFTFPSWAISERTKAKEAFLKLVIPSRKHEEYRYLNMELLLKDDFSFSTNKILTPKDIVHTKILKDTIVIVLQNGIFIEELSGVELPKGLKVMDLSKASSDPVFQMHYAKYADVNADAFIAMNTAFSTGGIFIHVEKNVFIEKPLHIIHVVTSENNLIVNTRNLIVAEDHSQVKIVESFESVNTVAKTFLNALTEIVVGQQAIVEHTKIQNQHTAGNLLSTTQTYQQGRSVLTSNTFTFDGGLVRNNLNMVLDEEHIETHLNGLYLTKENQVVDNHTLVDHRKPNCNSNELYKGLIDDRSSATFNGKIFVRKDAQKTNAFQSNKNILLSDDGTINTKPQLEIYADDVKCSHGTSTGKLDEDKIFYLRARGLSESSAKRLLMHAFASEVVDQLSIDQLKEYVEERISERLK